MSAEHSKEDELAELAHEFKTPIAAIKGFAELLATRSDEGSRREAAAQIAVGIERLEKSIDDILTLFDEDPQLVARLAELRGRSGRPNT